MWLLGKMRRVVGLVVMAVLIGAGGSIPFPEELITTGFEPAPGDTVWGHTLDVYVKTSNREFAGTVGSVFITFFGDRGVSERLLLGTGFGAGTLEKVTFTLSREIGALSRIKLTTDSTDGWLLASIWCDTGPTTYHFETTSLFLDLPDTALAVQDPVGVVGEMYEPQAPTKAPPGADYGETSAGIQGTASQTLKVVDRVTTFRNPVNKREDLRAYEDP